jgi:dihydrofolate synthase/folylpolyglutamate synthase
MTYSDAIQYLYRLRWFGTKFGLSNTLKLAALAGNPHHRLRFIHVAGTNGKGSTCAMLESIYRAAGLKVGLFTSPHLVALGERIQVNRVLISEAEIVRQVYALQVLLKQFQPDEHPTFFEVVTVLALRHFAEQNCDLVIWETGLGGRLDATNIVTPLASLITNVQFDHQQWLGDTLASIATEKAGIIKPGIPVLTTADAPEALRVIEEVAREHQSPLTIVTGSETKLPPLDSIPLPLAGQHQRLNAALAVATVRELAGKIPIADTAISTGLAKVHWDGRLQLITLDSGQEILLDGAHNIDGAQSLAAALVKLFPSAKPALILGILQDKNWPAMCATLAPLASKVLLTPVSSERTAPPEQLREACRTVNPDIPTLVCGSLPEAMARASEEPFVLVTGSLYLVGEALELLRVRRADTRSERGLNEWTALPEQQAPSSKLQAPEKHQAPKFKNPP